MPAKRLVDFVFAVIGLVLISPLMIFIALLVRLDTPGPVFFSQKRVGLGGRLFDIYKFRTMVENAEAMGPAITAQSDPRITQIGQVLRWLKLDELPQLFNVLKGDMSLVGPRPEIPQIVEKYSASERRVLSVKPGIIGPSQIANRDEASKLTDREDVEKFYVEKVLPEKLKIDLAYVESGSRWKDLKFLFGGLGALFLSSVKFRYILESKRRITFLVLDLVISIVSFWASFALRFEGHIPPEELRTLLAMLPFVLIVRGPSYVYFGLYQTLWQYLGFQELLAILKAVTAGSLLLPLTHFLLQLEPQPRSTLIIDWVLLITLLGGSRVIFKIGAERMLKKPHLGGNRKNVLIVGAEDSGEMLVREFINRPDLGARPIGFVDNDPQKVGMRIHGVKVIGTIAQLSQVIKVKKADEVIIALREASAGEMKEIIKICQGLHLPCRIVPQISLLNAQVLPLKLRHVDVADLLGRELFQADLLGIEKFVRDKRILITGGGGSIGSELARIIHQHHPRELILVDNTESNLYDIETELSAKPSETQLFFYLRNIVNKDDLRQIFEKHKPQAIYHAAAYKHVPLMELHYQQAILNNIVGTRNMADLAAEHGAECFVLISTDKAIRPRSIMGATKRVCELYIQSLRNSQTRFLAVRFGNVFNSKGSVVPLFRRQIEEGGPVTITDAAVTRYFMDVSEAVLLILQATILGFNSEIFILDMGNPVRIVDLAKNLMQMMRANVPIKYIGLRPGEKLEEEIILEGEQCLHTPHKKILIWQSEQPVSAGISSEIDELIRLVHQCSPRDVVVERLKKIVPEYNPWNVR